MGTGRGENRHTEILNQQGDINLSCDHVCVPQHPVSSIAMMVLLPPKIGGFVTTY